MNMPMHPNGAPFGWFIVALGTVATLWSIGVSLYWTIRPGETNPDHPKNIVLRSDR